MNQKNPTAKGTLGTATNNWTGVPLTLNQNDSASIQTPNGSMVLASLNTSQQNNLGQLTLTSGGGAPQNLPIPWGLQQPLILVQNWGANNLNTTNTSLSPSTSIWIEAFGPGIAGQTPATLTLGTPLTLVPLGAAAGSGSATATGVTNANYTQLTLTASAGTPAILALIGGNPDSSGNNAYVFALNSPAGDTGPGQPTPAPPGYYATTTNNSYTFQINGSSTEIYLANMSSTTAQPITVTLISL